MRPAIEGIPSTREVSVYVPRLHEKGSSYEGVELPPED